MPTDLRPRGDAMTPSPCLAGCTIRGQHVTECADLCRHKRNRETCGKRCDGTCKGCLPRPSEFGNLCAWCWQRMQSDVATAPALVQHLREVGEPVAHAAPPSDFCNPSDPAESTVLPDAWCAADEVHAALASWALLILEEHPTGALMAGPDEMGAWHTRYGAVVGVRTANATTMLVRWLLPLLPWCAEQDWAGVMRREIAELTATTLARWPMQDTRTRHVVGVQCVRCGCETLDYTPTKGEGLPFSVACVNPECGRLYTESEYDAALAQMTIDRGFVA